MPTYEYACRDCGHRLEVVQSFKDDPLETCERCGGPLRKVFSPAGVIFKGSGYYVTDTRKEAAKATTGSDGGSEGGQKDGAKAGGDTSEGASSDSPAKDKKPAEGSGSTSKSAAKSA